MSHVAWPWVAYFCAMYAAIGSVIGAEILRSSYVNEVCAECGHTKRWHRPHDACTATKFAPGTRRTTMATCACKAFATVKRPALPPPPKYLVPHAITPPLSWQSYGSSGDGISAALGALEYVPMPGCSCSTCKPSVTVPQGPYDAMLEALRTYGNNPAAPRPPATIPTARTLPTAEQTECIEGWRVWEAVLIGKDGYALQSVAWHIAWPFGKPLEAEDFNFNRSIAGVAGSDWGIYAAKSPVGACEAMTTYADSCVMGKVNLWGKVIEHERGYRGEYAYPSILYTENEKIAQSLRRNYGIEVSTKA